jgi:hypothetical protein
MLWQRTIAPSGAAFVTQPGSSWTGFYLVAALRGTALHRLSFAADQVIGQEVLFEDTFGMLRAVVEGPDGTVYVRTSNRDGRGDPAAVTTGSCASCRLQAEPQRSWCGWRPSRLARSETRRHPQG